jgi:hypothetical protein
MNINVPGSLQAGQTVAITATGGSGSGGDLTWSSTLGSTFSPNPSADSGGGVYSTNYTPPSAGTDSISVSDSDPTDQASLDVTVSAGGTPPPPPGGDPSAAALAFKAAMVADPNYCTSISQAGTPVHTTGAAFKTAFDMATSGVDGNPVPHNGLYDTACAQALAQVLGQIGGGTAPPVCGAPPPPPPTTCPAGQVQDQVTGACVAPCPDGSAPKGGECPAAIVPAGGMPKWLKYLLIALATAAAIFAGVMIYRGATKGEGGTAKKSAATEAVKRSKKKKRAKAKKKGKGK